MFILLQRRKYIVEAFLKVRLSVFERVSSIDQKYKQDIKSIFSNINPYNKKTTINK